MQLNKLFLILFIATPLLSFSNSLDENKPVPNSTTHNPEIFKAEQAEKAAQFTSFKYFILPAHYYFEQDFLNNIDSDSFNKQVIANQPLIISYNLEKLKEEFQNQDLHPQIQEEANQLCSTYHSFIYDAALISPTDYIYSLGLSNTKAQQAIANLDLITSTYNNDICLTFADKTIYQSHLEEQEVQTTEIAKKVDLAINQYDVKPFVRLFQTGNYQLGFFTPDQGFYYQAKGLLNPKSKLFIDQLIGGNVLTININDNTFDRIHELIKQRDKNGYFRIISRYALERKIICSTYGNFSYLMNKKSPEEFFKYLATKYKWDISQAASYKVNYDKIIDLQSICK